MLRAEGRERLREQEAAADLDLRCGYRSQLAKIDKEHTSKQTHMHTYHHASVCVCAKSNNNKCKHYPQEAFHCKNS